MNKKELDAFEAEVMKALKERESLGEFDANSEPILFLFKSVAIIVRHLNKKPAKKRKK